MSQVNTVKLGTKRKKQSLDANVNTTIKISGTLHRYFTTDKNIIPPIAEVDDSNQNKNKELNGTSFPNFFESKSPLNKVSPPSLGKLWPCFVKKIPMKEDLPKQIKDEEKLKAKSVFLESGAPTIILKKKLKIEEDDLVLDRPVSFPLISHVTQNEPTYNSKTESLPLPPTKCSSAPLINAVWKSITPFQLNEPEIEVFQRTGNSKTILDQLKEESPKTDVKALFKTLKMYKSKNVSNVWTEAYKPLTTLDLLGNSVQINKLKTWLDDLKKRKITEDESSGDEFVGDSDEEANNFSQNVAIIKGPCGSGKTSAVFAIANQLDCKVLEINTSNNRSGKRILAEFLESTQSHQVERVNTIEEQLSGNKRTKSKKRKRSRIEEERKMEKTSLILVEEADIVFEDIDEGFTQALFSLAASSKRPLILVANNTRNPHLERFSNSQSLEVCFSRPRLEKICVWLRVLGLVEGITITRAQAARLVQWARGDVRRCLLQLQIMLLSNNSEVQEHPSAVELWWNWPLAQGLDFKLPTLLKSGIDLQTETRKPMSKAELLERLQTAASITTHLACLDVLTNHSPLSGESPTSAGWQAQVQDSMLLTERRENADDKRCLEELAEWLLRSARGNVPPDYVPRCQTSREAKWTSVLRQGEQLYLSGVPWQQLTARDSLVCDYMVALRAIGRCDQVRLPVYTRRTSRMFNYLQGLGINASKSFNDFMCDAFS